MRVMEIEIHANPLHLIAVWESVVVFSPEYTISWAYVHTYAHR